MLYREAREYLDQVSVTGTILGLDSIRSLMKELGDPQEQLKIIHLAGTNGKGSILTYIRSVLCEAGYKVGTYSSPSVLGYLERFQINGEWMEEEELAPLVLSVKEAADRMVTKGLVHPTVFELETAIAFLYFYKNQCDYVVLEVGMGGDLDSTNVIRHPIACAFASISMDHVGVLGNNLEEIAHAKAGIIKEGTEVVIGWQKESVEKILLETADRMDAVCVTVKKDALSYEDSCVTGDIPVQRFQYREYKNLEIHLLGQHQLENVSTAIEVIRVLIKKGANITEEALRRGLRHARWPGRFEVIRRGERIFIIDGAHNEDAALRLAESLNRYYPKIKFEAVMGVFKDKDYRKIISILTPHLEKVYTIDLPNSNRTLDKKKLAEVLGEYGIYAIPSDTLRGAILQTKGPTLITGSLSYLGEARDMI